MKLTGLLMMFAWTLAAAELEQPPNKPGLQIKADFAIVDFKTNIVFYSNNVVVVDASSKPGGPPTTLTCRELRAKRGVDGNIEWIQADGDVEITLDQKYARGDRAIYTGATEIIEITGGQPLLVASGITNWGGAIIYDRRNERLSMRGGVTTTMPGGVLSGSRTNASSTATNKAGINTDTPSRKPLFSTEPAAPRRNF